MAWVSRPPRLSCTALRETEAEAQMRAPAGGPWPPPECRQGNGGPEASRNVLVTHLRIPGSKASRLSAMGPRASAGRTPNPHPHPGGRPHSYLHSRHAWGPVLAVNAWGSLLNRKIEGRFTMGRCLGSGPPPMSLCGGQYAGGKWAWSSWEAPAANWGRGMEVGRDFMGWMTVLPLCG